MSSTYKVFEWLRTVAFGNSRIIPSLDGLRAVAVMLVLFSHLCGTANFFLSKDSAAVGLGNFGVRIFFVISGYLITSILFAEYRKTGTCSLRRFYFRRSLRLFPAAYVFITFVAILGYQGIVQLQPYDLRAAYAYVMNFYEARSFPIGHLWSLAVEEQFYLIWPFAFLAMGPKRSVVFLKALLVIVPVLRLLSPYTGASLDFIVYSDSLGTGCLMALLYKDLEASPRFRRFLTPGWAMTAATIAVLANYTPSTKVKWLVGETTMNMCIALVVFWAISSPSGAVGRFLNWPPIAFVGVLSYSLYLWQQLFSHFGMHNHLTDFPLNLVLMFTTAMISYLFIETPCLRLRSLLERRMAGRRLAESISR